MTSNLSFFSDQKFRSIFYQTLVIGIFALAIYFIVNTTAYNLEKRNIATGFSFLNNPAGFDISFSPFLDYKSTDTHLKVYFVGVLNTLLVSFTGCIAATILGKANADPFSVLAKILFLPSLTFKFILFAW